MSVSTQEEDTRSIVIRTEFKPLAEYLNFLENTDKNVPVNVEIFDEIFQSFLKEEDFQTSLRALKLLLQKIEYYVFELANCKIAFNIGRLLDCFLKKFKSNLTDNEKNILCGIVPAISSNTLDKLKDTEYVIAMIFLKHYNPTLYKEEEDGIISRLEDNELIDASVAYFTNIYPKEQLKELISFEFRSFVLIRNTMKINEKYIIKTMDKLSGDYWPNWITIYANKMLAHIVVPIIAYKQNNLDEIDISDELLLKWLLIFSEKSLGKKLREDKIETISDEDFSDVWEFVRKHGTKSQRKVFYKCLIENGFEFHMSDPLSVNCFKDVTISK